MLDLVVLTLYLKVEPLAHSFFNLHHYTAVANNIPDGAHTVAIKYCGGMYYVYNAYNSDYFTRKMTESQLREYIGEGFFHGIGIG